MDLIETLTGQQREGNKPFDIPIKSIDALGVNDTRNTPRGVDKTMTRIMQRHNLNGVVPLPSNDTNSSPNDFLQGVITRTADRTAQKFMNSNRKMADNDNSALEWKPPEITAPLKSMPPAKLFMNDSEGAYTPAARRQFIAENSMNDIANRHTLSPDYILSHANDNHDDRSLGEDPEEEPRKLKIRRGKMHVKPAKHTIEQTRAHKAKKQKEEDLYGAVMRIDDNTKESAASLDKLVKHFEEDKKQTLKALAHLNGQGHDNIAGQYDLTQNGSEPNSGKGTGQDNEPKTKLDEIKKMIEKAGGMTSKLVIGGLGLAGIGISKILGLDGDTKRERGGGFSNVDETPQNNAANKKGGAEPLPPPMFTPPAGPVKQMKVKTGGRRPDGNTKSASFWELTAFNKLKQMGYTDEAAKTMVAEMGRENSFHESAMFGSHTDSANSAENKGIISWQGKRRKELEQFMAARGLLNPNKTFKVSKESLEAQLEFLDMESKRTDNAQYRAMNKAARMAREQGHSYSELQNEFGHTIIGWDMSGHATYTRAVKHGMDPGRARAKSQKFVRDAVNNQNFHYREISDLLNSGESYNITGRSPLVPNVTVKSKLDMMKDHRELFAAAERNRMRNGALTPGFNGGSGGNTNVTNNNDNKTININNAHGGGAKPRNTKPADHGFWDMLKSYF